MPEPDYQHRDIFDEAARQEMTALVRASGGGAMLLFTSYYAMNAAADYLARVLVYPVRRQNEAPKPALIEWLKARHDGVLCATASFWEGVDIPGESLRLLVIDKIPFAQPTPVEMARQGAAGRNAFLELSVPEATLKLKQGFGRLIRSCSDYGVVAMLDPRLWLKGYGRRIVGALPDARVVRSVGEVRAFFERRVRSPGTAQITVHLEAHKPRDPWAAALAELTKEAEA
jgi:ATP-dependent DNA helicase DinG